MFSVNSVASGSNVFSFCLVFGARFVLSGRLFFSAFFSLGASFADSIFY